MSGTRELVLGEEGEGEWRSSVLTKSDPNGHHCWFACPLVDSLPPVPGATAEEDAWAALEPGPSVIASTSGGVFLYTCAERGVVSSAAAGPSSKVDSEDDADDDLPEGVVRITKVKNQVRGLAVGMDPAARDAQRRVTPAADNALLVVATNPGDVNVYCLRTLKLLLVLPLSQVFGLDLTWDGEDWLLVVAQRDRHLGRGAVVTRLAHLSEKVGGVYPRVVPVEYLGRLVLDATAEDCMDACISPAGVFCSTRHGACLFPTPAGGWGPQLEAALDKGPGQLKAFFDAQGTGKEAKAGKTQIWGLDASSDGELVATAAGDGTVTVFSAPSMEVVCAFTDGRSANQLRFNPANPRELAVAADDGYVRIVDLSAIHDAGSGDKTGAEVVALKVRTPGRSTSGMTGAFWTSDGRGLATCTRDDSVGYIWRSGARTKAARAG